MQTQENDPFGLWVLGTLAGLALTAAGILFPNASLEARLLVTFAAFLPVLAVALFQGSKLQGLRARFSAWRAFLSAYYPLVMLVIVSVSVLMGLATFGDYPLVNATGLVVVGILAGTMSTLFTALLRRPSLRIVKGVGEEIYLIEDGVRRHIPDPATYQFISLFTLCALEHVSERELRMYREEPRLPSISSAQLVCVGAEVYAIWNGHKHLILDSKTWQHFFPGQSPLPTNTITLDKTPRGSTLFPLP